VIPVYNSIDSLTELVDRLNRVFHESVHATYEIVMVDDGSSRPETWTRLMALAARDPVLRAIQLTRNFGKNGALLCGMQQSRGTWIIMMDDDLQHRPEDLPLVIAERAHDMVFAVFPHRRHSRLKRAASRVKESLDRYLLGTPPGIRVSPFVMVRSDIVRAVLGIRAPYPAILRMLFHVTRDVVNVQVDHDPRKFGRSQFTIRKLLAMFLNLLLHNSGLLLNAVVVAGVLVSVAGFLLGGFVLLQTPQRGMGAPGWAALLVMLSLQGGLVMLALGVIGECLRRLVNGVGQWPAFVIRRTSDTAVD
jgi:dolichol-phosphate mannosyltransferase/undecaprenyl-phosphate 4-deoxy-4-formamido-L-arabinose transferase